MSRCLGGNCTGIIKRKEEKRTAVCTNNRPAVSPQRLVTGSQSGCMSEMEQKIMGEAKRWSHLRIVRVEVPSGESAGGGGENNQREEEM